MIKTRLSYRQSAPRTEQPTHSNQPSHDLLQQIDKKVQSRRTPYDKRELGVHEPRWSEKDNEHVVATMSPETIELLAIASMRHTGCNDADFEIRYSYGSGIGTNIVAKCMRCGQRFDITDYSNW